MMKQVELVDGLKVSAMGLGCMGMSGAYGEATDEASTAAIRRALDLGVTLFDTGDFYGNGHNERLLSAALGDDRRGVAVATKTGVVRTPEGMRMRGDRASLHAACEASAARLRTESIDLYYLARVDPQVPIEESVGAMAELVEAGKVRCLGLSEVAAGTLRRACAVHPVAALQSEYAVSERHVEAEILPAARELGVTFVASSPLGRGLLTGTVRSAEEFAGIDFRQRSPRFQSENLARNLNLVDELVGLAGELGITAAQLALAWVHAQGDDLISIPGTRDPSRVAQNVGALEVALSAEALARLDAAVATQPLVGERYPAPAMRTVGV